jgi:hypothetical protein
MGPSSQAIFFLPRLPVSRVMKSAIRGERVFLTERNSAMTVSIYSTAVRAVGFAAGGSSV